MRSGPDPPAASGGDRGRTTLTSVQAGRGMAALLVVLFHASLAIFVLGAYWGADPMHGVFDFGAAGVHWFFVLSGFVIVHAHAADAGRPERLARYARNRVLRIYPVYWIVLVGVLPVYLVVPSLYSGHLDVATVLSSVLLVHVDLQGPILLVAWTLFHEVLFYALFALVIWRRRVGLAALATWGAASVVVAFVAHGGWVDFLLAPVHLLFVMGALAGWVHLRGTPVPGTALAVGGTVAFFAMGAFESADAAFADPALTGWVYGLGATAAVLGLADLERRGRLRAPRVLAVLGDASYSIYLVHLPLLSLLAKAMVALGMRGALPPVVSYLLLVAAVVGLGVLVHVLVERPVLRRLRARAGARSERRPATPSPTGALT